MSELERTAHSKYGYYGTIFGTINRVFAFLAANWLVKKTASTPKPSLHKDIKQIMNLIGRKYSDTSALNMSNLIGQKL